MRGALFFTALLLLAVTTLAQPTKKFTVNTRNVTGTWTHYFEQCVGSGHAALALRADWQEQMRQTRNDIGFKQVRFHGLFVDDMSVVLPAENGNGWMFSFFNIDRIFDFLLSIGMRPFVEIGFMPALLASGTQTWSHYQANITPPKNWSDWSDLIIAFMQHLIDRYGLSEILTWNFEVWNEPNCCPHNFWTGSQADYFKLFEVTSRAAKSVDPRIRMGGPVTAMSAWIPEFLDYCHTHNVSYDFVSTHEYPTDPPGPETRTFFGDVLQKTRNTVGKTTPLYYTEYDDGYNDDTSYAAAFAVFQAYRGNNVVDALSWWPFNDLFEEQGLYPDPFANGFLPVAGLQNVYGIPKPSYRAFELMHWTGQNLVQVSPGFLAYDTLAAFAVTGNNTSIFFTNWDIKKKPPMDQRAQVTVEGVSSSAQAVKYVIDDTHANAYPLWLSMGKPSYLTPKQVELLKQASQLVSQSVELTRISDDSVTFTVDVPSNSVVNVILI